MNKTLEKVLYNAIAELANETYGLYVSTEDWLKAMYEKLNSNKEELAMLGIAINDDGTVSVDFEKEINSIKEKNNGLIKPLVADISLYDVASAGVDSFTFVPGDSAKNIYPENKVIFVNGAFSKIMLPNVYIVERILKEEGRLIFTFRKDVKINMEKAYTLLAELKK